MGTDLENDLKRSSGRDTHRPTLLSSPSCQDVLEAVKKSDVTFTVKLHGGLHSPHPAELINLQRPPPCPHHDIISCRRHRRIMLYSTWTVKQRFGAFVKKLTKHFFFLSGWNSIMKTLDHTFNVMLILERQLSNFPSIHLSVRTYIHTYIDTYINVGQRHMQLIYLPSNPHESPPLT